MEIKHLNNNHFNQVYDLQTYAFVLDSTEDREKKVAEVWEHSTALGAFSDDETLQSSLLIRPYTVFLHGHEMKMGGIGDVASYPEARGQGNIRALFNETLKIMKEKKMLVSYLAPFSYSFYRKFGYELVFEEREYTIKPENLKTLNGEEMASKRVEFEKEKETLNTLYTKKYTNSVGPVKREEWAWNEKKRWQEDLQIALCLNEEGEAEGYVIYYFKKDKGNTFVIDELVGLNAKAEKSLWQFIASHAPQINSFHYRTASLNDLTYLFKEPRLNQKWHSGMMARIVDMEAFLREYPFQTPTHNKSLLLKVVNDSSAEWNNGLYELKWTNQKVTVEKLSDEAIDQDEVISGDIQMWTQLFMGTRSAEQLHYEENLTEKKEWVQSLQEMIKDKKPELYDFF